MNASVGGKELEWPAGKGEWCLAKGEGESRVVVITAVQGSESCCTAEQNKSVLRHPNFCCLKFIIISDLYFNKVLKKMIISTSNELFFVTMVVQSFVYPWNQSGLTRFKYIAVKRLPKIKCKSVNLFQQIQNFFGV